MIFVNLKKHHELIIQIAICIMNEIKFVVVEPEKRKEETDIEKAYKDLMKTIEIYEQLFKDVLGEEIEEFRQDIVSSLKDFNRKLKDRARTKMR